MSAEGGGGEGTATDCKNPNCQSSRRTAPSSHPMTQNSRRKRQSPFNRTSPCSFHMKSHVAVKDIVSRTTNRAYSEWTNSNKVTASAVDGSCRTFKPDNSFRMQLHLNYVKFKRSICGVQVYGPARRRIACSLSAETDGKTARETKCCFTFGNSRAANSCKVGDLCTRHHRIPTLAISHQRYSG